jgi:hypothetical protein
MEKYVKEIIITTIQIYKINYDSKNNISLFIIINYKYIFQMLTNKINI